MKVNESNEPYSKEKCTNLKYEVDYGLIKDGGGSLREVKVVRSH